MAGLAAAARLATREHSVLVCEAGHTVGGMLGSWQYDGLIFDTGAYTLTLPAAYRDLFIKTGSRKRSAAAALEDRVELRALDPVRRYIFPDGTRLDLPNASRGRLYAAFNEALGPGAGQSWLNIVDHGSRVWDTIRPVLVEAPGSGERELARLLRTAAGRRVLTPLRSLRSVAGRWFTDPRLFLLLDDYARQAGAGADARRAPGVLAAHIYIEHAFGAWQIVGGMYTLAEELRLRVLERGAEIRYGARAIRIERSASGAVSGVLLEDGERIAADIVVAGVDQAVLTRMLDQPSVKTQYSPPVGTLCLVVQDPPPMPHETVLLDENGPAVRVHVAEERPMAWTVHMPAVTGARLDPDGVLDALAARGIDIRRKVLARHVITAADREMATGVPGGSAYGPAVTSLRTALLRSPVRQPVAGLFHVGASARVGGGLSFAALSAWQATELITGA